MGVTSFFSVFLIFCMSSYAQAQLLPGVFGNNIVLQRGGATLYGTTTANAALTIKVNNDPVYNAQADNTGAWKVTINYAASTGNVIVVTSGSTTQTLNNVAFGEVLLCSGQANMQYTVPDSFNFNTYANDNFPNIRWFTVDLVPSVNPITTISNSKTAVSGVQSEAGVCGTNTWCLTTPTTLNQGTPFDPANGNAGDPFLYPSAVCYFTMRNLYMALGQTVPVGGVVAAISGTPIEAWTSIAGVSKYGCPSDVTPATSSSQFGSGNNANYYWTSCMWNGMVNPLTKMTFKATLWYQGEGNSDSVDHGNQYACQLKALINDWRTQFNSPNMPFVVIMITPWPDSTSGGGYFEYGRQSQLQALALPNTAVTCTIDLGDNPDLDPTDHGEHPESKDQVGQRVYQQLFNLAYGGNLVANGPQFGSVTWPSAANNYQFVFDYSTSPFAQVPYSNTGLKLGPTAKCTPAGSCCSQSPYVVVTNANKAIPSGATVASGYRILPVISGTTVTVQLTATQFNEGVVYIAMDYEGYPNCALFNGANLPAYPFILTSSTSQAVPIQPSSGSSPTGSPVTPAPTTTAAPGATTTKSSVTTNAAATTTRASSNVITTKPGATTTQPALGNCGNGIVGNGICVSTDGPCCSIYGYCGSGTQYCGNPAPTVTTTTTAAPTATSNAKTSSAPSPSSSSSSSPSTSKGPTTPSNDAFRNYASGPFHSVIIVFSLCISSLLSLFYF